MVEKLPPNRGTKLRKNGSESLEISLDPTVLNSIFLINGPNFLTEEITPEDLVVPPKAHYMVINKGEDKMDISYSHDVSRHSVVYDPYKYENKEKQKINPKDFKKNHSVQNGYVDILPKWYSIKFTYPDYNIIYIKPEMGISFQIHEERTERWEILGGTPIILNHHSVHYYVDSGITFENPIGTYHSVINPNKKGGEFVVLKEQWSGNFDEQDITRVFNPNHYNDD